MLRAGVCGSISNLPDGYHVDFTGCESLHDCSLAIFTADTDSHIRWLHRATEYEDEWNAYSENSLTWMNP